VGGDTCEPSFSLFLRHLERLDSAVVDLQDLIDGDRNTIVGGQCDAPQPSLDSRRPSSSPCINFLPVRQSLYRDSLVSHE